MMCAYDAKAEAEAAVKALLGNMVLQGPLGATLPVSREVVLVDGALEPIEAALLRAYAAGVEAVLEAVEHEDENARRRDDPLPVEYVLKRIRALLEQGRGGERE